MAAHFRRFPILLVFALPASLACSAGGEGAAPGVGANSSSGGGTGATVGMGGTGAVVNPTDPANGGANAACDSVLEVTLRDFGEAHPDFEMDFRGDVVRRELVAPALGTDQKPLFASSIGCPADMATPLACDATWEVSTPTITSAESFFDWYHTVAGVNVELHKELDLSETAPGSGQYVYESATFFPLAPNEGLGPSPVGHYTGRNYLFTTEIHVMFGYQAGQRFTFSGDDDLWIFVNGRLAMDLGSMHGPADGVIDFDAQAANLGIAVGYTYSMDIFHAERHTDGSNFKVTTNISCFTPVVVR